MSESTVVSITKATPVHTLLREVADVIEIHSGTQLSPDNSKDLTTALTLLRKVAWTAYQYPIPDKGPFLCFKEEQVTQEPTEKK